MTSFSLLSCLQWKIQITNRPKSFEEHYYNRYELSLSGQVLPPFAFVHAFLGEVNRTSRLKTAGCVSLTYINCTQLFIPIDAPASI